MTTQDTMSATEIVATFSNKTFKQLINGELVSGSTSQPVINPSTGNTFATAPVANHDDVESAVAAAKQAFKTWRHTSITQREEVIRALISEIEVRHEEIAYLVALELGKPLSGAQTDVELGLTWARELVDSQLHFLEPTLVRDTDTERIEVHYQPAGIVAAIVPWNFPFFQTMYKLVPALLAGNSLVIKPAPTSPLNAMLLAELLAPLVPAGVVNIIGDSGDVGPQLSNHPDIDHISFTGSTAVGRKIVENSAETLKRVVLELGGNDAAIVLEDADIEVAADGIYTFAFTNSGQVCINIKRIFVPSTMHDEFVEAMGERVRRAKVGDALDPQTELGPIQNERQFERVKGYLETAKRDGTIVAGGNVINRPGYFVEPTLVTDVDPASSLINEETFGPIRSIIAYDSIEQAIQQANETHYGLGNSIWAKDIDKAAKIATELESGTVWINNHFALAPDVPFGGQKQSGLGAEFGREGLLEFTEMKVINITK